jgi:transcriptional regulator with XRE-family HTH domain
MALGDKIKHFRELRGLSVQELADKMDTGKQNIYNWEDGTTIPSIPNLTALALALEVPISVLLEQNNTYGQNLNQSKELVEQQPAVLQALVDGNSTYRLVPNALLEGRYTIMHEDERKNKNDLLWVGLYAKNDLIAQLKRDIQKLEEDIAFFKAHFKGFGGDSTTGSPSE